MTLYNAQNSSAVGDLPWLESITNVRISGNADRAIIQNSDGSRTYLWSALIGGNLTYDGLGNLTGGTIRWMTRTDAAGNEYENIGSTVSNINVAAASFWTADTNARIDTLFGGNDTFAASADGNGNIMIGGAGADSFTGGAGSDTVSYKYADSFVPFHGVVADLQVTVNNDGEALGDSYSSIENLIGSAFGDSLNGNAFANHLEGGDGPDFLEGRGGNDVLEGGGGDDLVYAGADDDLLYGGTSGGDQGLHDTIHFFGAGSGIIGINVTLGANGDGDVTFAGTGHDIFTGFENVVGTDLSDTIVGNAADNVLQSLDGIDYLQGGGGSDILMGDGGNDTLQGGAGDDYIHGGDGTSNMISWADAAVGVLYTLPESGAGVITISGLGTDTFDGIQSIEGSSTIADWLLGNSVGNLLSGGGGDDILAGMGGNDSLWGGAGDDFMQGGAGDDTILGGMPLGDDGGRDMISFFDASGGINFTLDPTGNGTANFTALGLGIDSYFGIEGVNGTDLGDAITGNSGNNRIFGNNGNDDIRSGAGNDELVGGDGDDYLQAGTGSDIITGGNGSDQMSFYDLSAGVTFTLSASGDGSVTIGADTDTYTSIENIAGSDAGAFDDFTGVTGADTLTGNAGANVIDGYWGNDTLTGAGGGDTMNGGFGNDLMFGGTGEDKLYGNDDNDSLVGNNGGADLFAQDHDILDGGAGNDNIHGEYTDTVVGGSGIDNLYAVNDFAWTIDIGLAGFEWMQAGFGNDHIFGTLSGVAVTIWGGGGNDEIIGSDFNDFLWAGAGDDTVTGGIGNDMLFGDAGADSLTGGEGNDTLYADANDSVINGGKDFDVVYLGSKMKIDMSKSEVESVVGSGGDDTIDGASMIVDATAYGGGGNDTISGGSGADFLWGEAGNDTITGGSNNDTLVGGIGSDNLTGGTGVDTLYMNSGGGGDGVLDTAFYTATGWGTDFIYDFEHAIDKINMQGTGATAGTISITNSGGHAHVHFGADLIVVANGFATLTTGDFIF